MGVSVNVGSRVRGKVRGGGREAIGGADLVCLDVDGEETG